MSATSTCFVETVHSSSETDRCHFNNSNGNGNDDGALVLKEVDPFDKSSSWYTPSTSSSHNTPAYSPHPPPAFVDLYSSLASRQKPQQQQSSTTMHQQLQQQQQQHAIIPMPQRRTQTTIIPYHQPPTQHQSSPLRSHQPHIIATISAGFEKGDYLIRETHGSNVYFDFFEEAYNFACQKGFSRMAPHEEIEYMDLVKRAHKSIPGGCRYNTGRLLMVLRKKLVPLVQNLVEDGPCGLSMEDVSNNSSSGNSSSLSPAQRTGDKQKKKKQKQKQQNKSNNNRTASYITTTSSKNKQQLCKKFGRSMNTLPTDSETSGSRSSSSSGAPQSSSAYSSSAADTSYVDSWE